MTDSAHFDEPINWNLATFDGLRRAQLRQWSSLPLYRILLAQEEMEDVSRQLHGKNYEQVLRESCMSVEELRAARRDSGAGKSLP